MRAKKRRFGFFYLFGLLLSAAGRAGAVTCVSTFQGKWSDPSAWQGGAAPTASNDVTLQSGCVLTVDVATAAARSLTINNGTLVFSTAAVTRLAVSQNVAVNSGGVLAMGTAAAPMPASKSATLVLGHPGSTAFGVTVQSGGTFSARGAAKSPAAQAVTDALAGATQVQVPDAQAAGWAVGDTVTLGQTEAVFPVSGQTEERVVSSLSSNGTNTTVSWSSGLAHDHRAANVLRVANLSRNVVILSSGTTAGVDMAYVRTWLNFSGIWDTEGAEFSRVSVNLSPAAPLSISSCSFHHGSGVLLANQGAPIFFTDNVVYAAASTGITLENGGHTLIGNDIVANASKGLDSDFTATGDTVLTGNFFYGNADEGFHVAGSQNVVENNLSWVNGAGGGRVDGSLHHVSKNVFRHNNGAGLTLGFSVDSVVSGNTFHDNVGKGLDSAFSGQDAILADNDAYANGSEGMYIAFTGSLVLRNRVYSNGQSGFGASADSMTFVSSDFGYGPGGSQPDAGGFPELNQSGSSVLKSCRINPVGGAVADGLLSFDQDASSGIVKVTGDVLVDAGQSLFIDAAAPLWRSTATAVRLLHGSDHSASVLSTSDSGAVTQLVTIRCLDGAANRWVVEGSTSGVLFGPFVGGLAGQDIGGQFTLTFAPDPFGGQRTDDRLAFALIGAAGDGGIKKELRFRDHPVGPAPSSLTIAPGASFRLSGTVGIPAVMDWEAGSSLPYTFVSSGSFSMDNAAIRHMAASGFQLSGAGGVSMSSVTFDTIGAAGGAYITAKDLVSVAVMDDIAFDPASPDPDAPLSVKVQGNDAGLSWAFASYSGNRSGPASGSDPNNRIYWVGATPVGTPGSFSAQILSDGINLSWTAPAMPPAVYRGGYVLSRSSVSATGPFTQIAAPAADATSYDDPGLQPQTTYYYRLWAADPAGNRSASPAAASRRTGDFSQPELLGLQSSELRTAGIGWTSPLTLTFNKAMLSAAVQAGVSLTRLSDNLGSPLSSATAVSISSDVTGSVFTVTPSSALGGNSLYELDVSTSVTDLLGQPLSSSASLTFTTLMDRTRRNVARAGAGGVTVDLPPMSLAEDGYLTGQPVAESAVAAATEKLSVNSGDPLRRPIFGSVAQLGVFDSSGAAQGPFASAVTVTIPYQDVSPADGVVDGSNPPARVDSLGIYWLDAVHNTWVPLPSGVDRAAHTVSAAAPHFTTFALMAQGDLELSGAHPFPVPYVRGRGAEVCGGVSGEGICFTGLPQEGSIRVYTPAGRLVRELSIPAGGQLLWDVRNGSGEDAASGVYLYEISNGHSSSVKGKLAVLR